MSAYDIFLKEQQELKAYDGDTLYGVEGDSTSYASDEALRLKGVNTPEMKGRYGRPQPGAEDAFETAQKYEKGATSEFGGNPFWHERGYYGRRLGDRRDAAGQLLSHELLSRGQAFPTSSSDPQQEAIANKFLLDNRGHGLNAPTAQQRSDFDTYQRNQAEYIDRVRGNSERIGSTVKRGMHSKAIDRGVDQVQQMGYGFMKWLGDSVGAEGISKLAKAGINEQELAIMFNPRETASWTESNGFADSLASLYESTIEQLPNIGTTLATAIATGGIGTAARMASARIAAGETAATKATQAIFSRATGAGAASFGMNTGETKITFDAEGIDNNSKVFFTGLVKGALDMAGLSRIPGVNRLAGMGARGAGVTTKKLWKEVPFNVMKAAAAEGTTEAFQAVADAVAVNTSLDREWSDKDTATVIESFVVGAAVGKAVALPGAATTTAVNKMQRGAEAERLIAERKERAEKNPASEEIPQTKPEPEQDIEIQQERVKQEIKGASFVADDKIKAHRTGKNANPIIKKVKGLFEVRVNDGKQAGRSYFKQVKEAQAYRDDVNDNGIEAANKVMQPVGAPTKQEVADKAAQGDAPVVVQKVTKEGAVSGETLTNESQALKQIEMFEKEVVDGEVVESKSPEEVLSRREQLLAEEKEERAIRAKRAKNRQTKEDNEATGVAPEPIITMPPPTGDIELAKQKVKKINDTERVKKAQAEKTGRKPTKKERLETAEVAATPVLTAEQASEIEPISDGQAMDEQLTVQEKLTGNLEDVNQIQREQEERDKVPEHRVLHDKDAIPLAKLREMHSKAKSPKEKAILIKAIQQAKKRKPLKRRASHIIKKKQASPKNEPGFNRTRMRSVKKALHKALRGRKRTITKKELLGIFDGLPPKVANLYKKLFADSSIINAEVNPNTKGGKRGRFSPVKSNIEVGFNEKNGDMAGGEILLHELLHSVSYYHARLAVLASSNNMTAMKLLEAVASGKLKGLRDVDKKLVTDIAAQGPESIRTAQLADAFNGIYNAFKSHLDQDGITNPEIHFGAGDHHFSNVMEFIAAGLSNENVMEYLNSKVYENSKKSLWEKLVDLFAKYFRIKDKSLLQKLLSSTIKASADSARLNNKLNAKNYVGTKNTDSPNFTLRQRIPLNRITKGIRDVFTKDSAFKIKEGLFNIVKPFLTSLGRLKKVSPSLGRLYEKYHRQFQADESQFKAQLNNIYREHSEQELDAAFSEYIHGEAKSVVAKKLEKFFAEFAKNIGTSPVKHFAKMKVMNNGRPYFPQIHQQDVIRADREKFVTFLLTGKKGGPFSYLGYDGKPYVMDKKAALEITESLLSQVEGESTGPAASSAKRRVLTDAAYQAAAFDAGWLNKDPRAVMETYISSMMKQKNYEEVFGGYEVYELDNLERALRTHGYTVKNKDPQSLRKAMKDATDRGLLRQDSTDKTMYEVWVAGSKKAAEVGFIREQKGRAEAEEAQKAMDAMDGLLGRGLNPKIRKSMQWATVVQAYTILAFSTLSSIPELGVMMAGAIGKDPESAWKGLKQFVRDTASYAKDINKAGVKNARNQSIEIARLMGVIPDALTATGFIDTSDFEVSGNKPRAAMEKLFTYNLNILFNNSLRSIANNIGAEYFIKKAKAGDAKAIDRFGVTPEQVLQWDKEGRQGYIEGTSQLSPMANALLNFADHHVARPTSMSKAVFGNDPHFMLVSQLKSFFYAYGADIIPEIGRTMAGRYSSAKRNKKVEVLAGLNASMPLVVIAAMAVPLAYLSQEIKASIRELADDDYEERRDKYLANMGTGERLLDLVRASGVLGPVDLMMSFYDAEQFGQSGAIRALGPTMGHLDTLIKYGPFSPEFVQRTTPILGITSPGLWGEWKKEARAERRKKRYND